MAPIRLTGAGRAGGIHAAREATRAARAGFTLLELLVVLLIIALLAGYVGPRLFSQVDKARVKSANAQMKTLADAVTQYRLDTGHYPSEQEGLNALVQKGSDPRWDGPYLAKGLPSDPWGHAYLWKNPGAGSEVEIISLGKDGKPGGSGDDKDLVYGF
ncbi:type II secretion system protein GspG [Cupriavidus necator]|uniref:Type II secretion system core protein G n=1 Tax=Cupriavidus necator TaxID=106590 RepID=A0A1U9USF4_CUPNE|nr:type II secretion system major pseudopilin GspG [Cupriavidus necator]AQV95636.1 type II secretion system protein GspG [Cupriavidus necator]